MDDITKKAKAALKKHAKHHSAKHIAMMKKDMKNGKTLKQAHNKAVKKVGAYWQQRNIRIQRED